MGAAAKRPLACTGHTAIGPDGVVKCYGPSTATRQCRSFVRHLSSWTADMTTLPTTTTMKKTKPCLRAASFADNISAIMRA